MRERLIDLLKGAEEKVTETLSAALSLDEWLGIYADHLLANGVIVPPCKVGDKIYLPWEFDGIKSIAGLTVTHVIFDREHDYVKTDFHTDDEAYYDKYKCGSYEFEDFGKTVFLTREEAEQALRKEDEGK